MWNLYGVFEDGEDDRKDIVEGAKPLWTRDAISKSAFVVYEKSGKYIDSIDPIEVIYHINDILYIDHCDVGLFKINTDKLNKNKYITRIEYELFDYERKRGDISSEDVILSGDSVYIQK